MKNLFSSGFRFATLALLGLGLSTSLSGCFDKDHDHDGPKGSVCNTAATVVTQDGSTALALRLADGSLLVPTGALWTDFHAKAGEKVLVGLRQAGKSGHGSCHKDDDDDDDDARDGNMGCISVNAGAN